MKINDLKKLEVKVAKHGPSALLPCNFPIEWLTSLDQDLRTIFLEQSEDYALTLVPLGIIFKIVQVKFGDMAISEEDLSKYFDHFRYEIALELQRRRGDVSVESATIKTIFTDRDISVPPFKTKRVPVPIVFK